MAADLVKPDATICSSDTDILASVMDLTDGRGVDVAITAAAAGITQEQALQYVARQGRISFFGGLPKDNPVISVDSNVVHYRDLTIVGANGSNPQHNDHALQLISSGDVPVADLITHRLPLDHGLDALQIVAAGDAIKVTIEP
jgi:L-iditol 2-dehydrogenase